MHAAIYCKNCNMCLAIHECPWMEQAVAGIRERLAAISWRCRKNALEAM
jgi:hypothetical protein